jgi:PHD/YefM family antitoxin component YafN of YafNO toxin-antitoxin module
MSSHLYEPNRVDEPRQAEEYADVISKVVTEKHAVMLRREGADAAVIIPLDQWEILAEALAMEECQRLLKTMNLREMAKSNPPPQAWFDIDEPKPF